MNERSNDISLLPDGLNRFPTVYKGFSIPELFKCIGFGMVIGFILGLFVFFIIGYWITIVFGTLLVPIPTVFFVGNRIQQLKRGKPESWLQRYIELQQVKCGFSNKNRLLYNDEHFITTRKKK